jgi:hypothetical protein
MIARIWKGVVRVDDADVYADYIRETGFAEYAQTSGNRGAWMLRRDKGDRTEFITPSLWDSVDAIRPSPATTSRPRSSTRRTSATSSAASRR